MKQNRAQKQMHVYKPAKGMERRVQNTDFSQDCYTFSFDIWHLSYNRGDNVEQREKNDLSVNGAGSIGYPYGKKIHLPSHIKVNPWWITELNAKVKQIF